MQAVRPRVVGLTSPVSKPNGIWTLCLDSKVSLLSRVC